MIEIKLKHLDQIQEAFDLVRNNGSAQSALIIADYCQNIIQPKDYRGAIEFLLLANKSDEAFQLSQDMSLIDYYILLQGNTINSNDSLKIAYYYEKIHNYSQAGRFYSINGQYAKALKLLFLCGDSEIDECIKVVGKSQSEPLIHQLIDYLVGEKDGIPKDPNYIYRLYMALKRYEDASKTAIIIAKQEQDLGNYPLAHSVLIETIQSLENESLRLISMNKLGIKISLQLRTMFILLHSYMLAKIVTKHNDHLNASKLLLRISSQISKFPSHIIPILISTVIECQRSGLKSSAYEYAVILMKPEYRSNIDVNIRRKIEAIVRRKSSQVNDTDNLSINDELTEDPITKELISSMKLESPISHDQIPMCIITGKHMILKDWCYCPNSNFPALYSEYIKYIENDILLQINNYRKKQENLDINNANSTDEEPATAVASLDVSTIIVLDPIMNKPINKNDIILQNNEIELLKYIQRYNNIFEINKEIENSENNENDNNELTDDLSDTNSNSNQITERTNRNEFSSMNNSKNNNNQLKLREREESNNRDSSRESRESNRENRESRQYSEIQSNSIKNPINNNNTNNNNYGNSNKKIILESISPISPTKEKIGPRKKKLGTEN